MLKWMIVAVIALLSLASCATEDTRWKTMDMDAGYEETFYPPNCWVQPSHSELWYPCGHAPGQKEQMQKEMEQGHYHSMEQAL